jgi:hydroxyacylglutathione hydrolase
MNISVNPIKALQDNYIWAIENNATRTAIIVDPGEAIPVLTYLQKNKLQLVAILITHHHWDHTNGISDIIETMNVPVYGPAIEAISTLTQPVKQDSIISFTDLPTPIQVLHIPGHTLGHLAFYVDG